MRNAVAGGLLFLAMGVHGAPAQTTYPDHTVRIVVPSPPGGVTDILARVVAQAVSQSWGQPVIVDNRPGADEMIGAVAVTRSPPDGYTLLVASNSPITSGPHLHLNKQYESPKDFTPIMVLGQITPVMSVPAASPVTSVQDLIARAKANPGGMSYASFGTGTYAHVAMEDFKSRTGTQILHIPYKGASPAVTAMLQGEVDVMIMNIGNIAEHVKAGTVRIIAAAGARRSAIMPDLPTIAELGVAGFSTGSWWGLFGPANLPPAIVDKIRADVRLALDAPDARKIFATATLQPLELTTAQFAQFIRDDYETWGRQIAAAGIQPD